METLLQLLATVRRLLLSGDISEAMETLLRHETKLPFWVVTDVQDRHKQWSILQLKWQSGVIDHQEKNIEEALIANALLHILDALGTQAPTPKLKPPAPSYPAPSSPSTPVSSWKTLIVNPIREIVEKFSGRGAHSLPKMVEPEVTISDSEPPEAGIMPTEPEPETPRGGIEMSEPPASVPASLQDLQPDTPGDTVVCSAFAPPEAKLGEDILVQVWAHLPENRQEAMAYAAEFDPGTSMRQFRTLSAPFEKGDEITFVMTAKNIEIEQNAQNLIWTGQTESVQFFVSVPPNYFGEKLFFTLTAYKNTLPVGQLLFTIGLSQTPETKPTPLGTEARRFRKAFVSYSSNDRPEVLRRVQMLGIFDVDFFMDLLSLDPGERWEKGLYKNIDTCDVFLLFWSSHAKASKWVLQEIQYALARKHGDENAPPHIQPVPIEGPPIVSPPPELGHMHFNDKILYFLAATPPKR